MTFSSLLPPQSWLRQGERRLLQALLEGDFQHLCPRGFQGASSAWSTRVLGARLSLPASSRWSNQGRKGFGDWNFPGPHPAISGNSPKMVDPQPIWAAVSVLTHIPLPCPPHPSRPLHSKAAFPFDPISHGTGQKKRCQEDPHVPPSCGYLNPC